MLRQARATKRKTKVNPGSDKKTTSGPSPTQQLKKVDAQLVELTEKIAVAEARIDALNALFCQENYYKNTPTEEDAALQAEQRMLTEEVRLFMIDWEALERQGEELREQTESGG